jgi:hypothetical protein
MKAIPTLYQGIQMRSRLEAKWASVFDQLGWKWEYEPIDLDGWIPDFVIQTKSIPLLVEIKPVFEFPHAVAKKVSKYCESGEYNVLIGAARLMQARHFPENYFGWLSNDFGWYPEDIEGWNGAAPMGPEDGKYGLHTLLGPWDDVIGDVERKHFIDDDELKAIWTRAGNAVQWKAPR